MKGSLALTTALVLLLVSCHQNDFTDAVLAHIQSEAVTDSYQGESVDISSVAMNNTTETLSGGRYGVSSREIKGLGDIDERFKCAVVTHYKDPNSSEANPIGKITMYRCEGENLERDDCCELQWKKIYARIRHGRYLPEFL